MLSETNVHHYVPHTFLKLFGLIKMTTAFEVFFLLGRKTIWLSLLFMNSNHKDFKANTPVHCQVQYLKLCSISFTDSCLTKKKKIYETLFCMSVELF